MNILLAPVVVRLYHIRFQSINIKKILAWVLICSLQAQLLGPFAATTKAQAPRLFSSLSRDAHRPESVKPQPKNSVAPSWLTPDVSPTGIADTVVTRHKPTLNSGRIEGSLRVFMGESFTINGSSQITSDLFLPGTPSIQLNGGSQHGGIVEDGGSTTPTNHTLTPNGNANLPASV